MTRRARGKRRQKRGKGPAVKAQRDDTSQQRDRRGGLTRSALALLLVIAGGGVAWFAIARSGAPDGSGQSPAAGKPVIETAERRPQQVAEIPAPDTALMQEDVRDLIDRARQAVVADRLSAEAWSMFGEVCDAHQLYECAEVCYGEADRLAPNTFRYVYFLARMLDEQGKYPKDVIAGYRQAIRLRADYIPTYVRLGLALEKQGWPSDARQVFERAIQVDPQSAYVERCAGQIAWAEQRVEDAIRHWERSAELDPTDGVVMASLGRAYQALGRTEDAQRAITESTQLDRRNRIPDPIVDSVHRAARGSPIRFHQAKKLIEQGEYAEALEHLEVVKRATPDLAIVQHYLGVCYRRTGSPQLAEQHLRRAIELKDDLAAAMLEISPLLLESNQVKDAVQFAQRAYDLLPDDAHAQLRLAAALVHDQQFAAAIPLFAESEQNLVFNQNGYMKWGYALRMTGDLEGAIRRLKVAVQLAPSHPDGHYQLGMALEASGNSAVAIEHYRRAAAISPNHPAARRLEALAP